MKQRNNYLTSNWKPSWFVAKVKYWRKKNVCILFPSFNYSICVNGHVIDWPETHGELINRAYSIPNNAAHYICRPCGVFTPYLCPGQCAPIIGAANCQYLEEYYIWTLLYILVHFNILNLSNQLPLLILYFTQCLTEAVLFKRLSY